MNNGDNENNNKNKDANIDHDDIKFNKFLRWLLLNFSRSFFLSTLLTVNSIQTIILNNK